jgi:hypothetical protein
MIDDRVELSQPSLSCECLTSLPTRLETTHIVSHGSTCSYLADCSGGDTGGGGDDDGTSWEELIEAILRRDYGRYVGPVT